MSEKVTLPHETWVLVSIASSADHGLFSIHRKPKPTYWVPGQRKTLNGKFSARKEESNRFRWQLQHRPFQSHDLVTFTDLPVPTPPGLVVISDLLCSCARCDNSPELCCFSVTFQSVQPPPGVLELRFSGPDSSPHSHGSRFVPGRTSTGVIRQLLLRREHLSPRRIFSGET